MANAMYLSSLEHHRHLAALLIGLGMATVGTPLHAQIPKRFFECAQDPKKCANAQRDSAPAVAPVTGPTPSSTPSRQPLLLETTAAEQQARQRLELQLREREEEAERARNESESLRKALEEARIKQALQQPAPIRYQPGRRQALLIGNNAYQKITPLLTARQDAQAMSEVLKSLGFQVSLHTDLAEKPMKQALRDFKQQVQAGDEVLVFFAGHGVQIGGTNYLLPVDIRGEGEDQVRDDAIPLQRILDDLQERKAGFSLAVIDACRDNPFRSTGRAVGGRGLAPTTATSGQMIIFSAGAGQQAMDRLPGETQANNGVFTRVFLREMTRENVPIDRVLRAVRQEVVELARQAGVEQTPALYDQAVGDFYFKVTGSGSR